MAAQECPVSDDMMEAMADAALGPDPELEPMEVPDVAPGAHSKHRQVGAEAARRARLLAMAPCVQDALSARRKRTFIQALGKTGNIAASAAFAGWSRGIPASLRRTDAEFAKAWDYALETYVSRLELEADRRAVDGVEVGVYHKGELVGTEVRYSDTLLVTLLKANAREKYGDKLDQTVTQKGGVLVVPAAPGSTADWESAAKGGQAKFRDSQEQT